MAKRPEEEPMGSATGLRLPSEAAAQRAKPLFDKLVDEMRTQQAASGTSSVPYHQPPLQFGGGRRYDVALALAGMQAAPVQAAPAPTAAAAYTAPATPPRQAPAPPPTPVVSSDPLIAALQPQTQTAVRAPAALAENERTAVTRDSSHEPTMVGTPPQPMGSGSMEATQINVDLASVLPTRPPANAPTVRPPVRRPTIPAPATEQLLEKTADMALLRTEGDGTMAFDIAFRDDIFDEVACTISVNKGRAIAVFRVRDDNTRRLIESEAGRLRAGLETRGLKVADIKVVLESS